MRLTFADLQDEAALLSLEHQNRLMEVFGIPAWRVNFDEALFEFTRGDGSTRNCEMQVLGSAAPGPESWMWAWAQPMGFRDDILVAAKEVRAFGEKHGIAELTSPEVPFSAFPGLPAPPDNAMMVSLLMMEASKAATGRYTGYSAPFGQGTRFSLLIDRPEFRLPEPTVLSFASAVRRGLAELRINDHRAAVHSYARRRGFGVAPVGPMLLVNGDNFSSMIQFDELNRLARMSTSKGAPEPPSGSGAPSDDVIALARGENRPLPAAQVTITVGSAFPLGLSAILLGADRRVRSDADLVFYNNPTGPGVSHRHAQGSDVVELDTTALPSDVDSVVVTASLDGSGPATFAAAGAVTATIGSLSFPLTGLTSESAVVCFEIYRRGADWKVRAVGQGYDDGRAAIAREFGITVDD